MQPIFLLSSFEADYHRIVMMMLHFVKIQPSEQNILCELFCDQGDEILASFSPMAIVYFGQFFDNCRSSPDFWGYNSI
jgi:hypothetical protein